MVFPIEAPLKLFEEPVEIIFVNAVGFPSMTLRPIPKNFPFN
jgi:hypothetical protein